MNGQEEIYIIFWLKIFFFFFILFKIIINFYLILLINNLKNNLREKYIFFSNRIERKTNLS
jgi:hypothetical protein